MKIHRGIPLGAVALVTALAGNGQTFGGQADTIPFPDDYRVWAHVKSALVGPQSAFAANQLGIHHIYANDPALEGYSTGKFPDGSIIVYDLLETIEVKGDTLEGPQRRVDVMVKQSQRYRDTGGWGFARFAAGDRQAGVLRPACFTCHARRDAHDFVFSEFREAAAAPASEPQAGEAAPAAKPGRRAAG